jgi:hypothetical protein
MAITTRETTATGVTNKGAPLTNAEVDTNFIELQQDKIELTDLSVTTNAAGSAALSYDNLTGSFSYTPPDLSSYLTSEVNDLTVSVTWANVPDANITQSSVTQHQAALSITESQISDLQSYLTAEVNDLTSAVTWANVPDANITQSSVTQHQGALSITESQISDLGSYIELSNLSVGAEGDATGDGSLAYNNSTGVFTYTPPADISGAVKFAAKAGEALTKGDVVYVSGVSGNNPVVSKADANNASKMPAFGLAEDNASNNASVNVITFGTLYGLDTSGFSAGDTLYVSTTAGGLTATKPSGESSLIQNIGKAIRSHASAGSIKVGGAGRTNDTPNLNDGNVFIGNASNQTEARALVEADISDLQTYLTTETNDLTVAVTWADVPDVNITQSSVTQHQSALSITESQISDLQSYLTAESDTLDLVTGRGASTTNSLTVGGLHVDSTDAVEMPVGTDAQRPTPVAGMLRFNTDSTSFEGYDGSAWGAIGGGGGATEDAFYENSQTLSANVTISAGRNAMTTGPLTVGSGYSVTIEAGCRVVVI